jgi:translation initiation factor 1
MAKKRTINSSGIIYSTNPEYKIEDDKSEEAMTLTPVQQKLRIRLDTKQRAGKAVTLIQEFKGSDQDLEDLGKKLKTFCGTGGSAKDGVIIIQGDQREKVLQWLLKNEYKHSKKV